MKNWVELLRNQLSWDNRDKVIGQSGIKLYYSTYKQLLKDKDMNSVMTMNYALEEGLFYW